MDLGWDLKKGAKSQIPSEPTAELRDQNCVSRRTGDHGTWWSILPGQGWLLPATLSADLQQQKAAT